MAKKRETYRISSFNPTNKYYCKKCGQKNYITNMPENVTAGETTVLAACIACKFANQLVYENDQWNVTNTPKAEIFRKYAFWFLAALIFFSFFYGITLNTSKNTLAITGSVESAEVLAFAFDKYFFLVSFIIICCFTLFMTWKLRHVKIRDEKNSVKSTMISIITQLTLIVLAFGMMDLPESARDIETYLAHRIPEKDVVIAEKEYVNEKLFTDYYRLTTVEGESYIARSGYIPTIITSKMKIRYLPNSKVIINVDSGSGWH
jgi:hypothetical protein